MKRRSAFFFDGFNLYHAINRRYPNYKWLDLRKLSSVLISSQNEDMQNVKYFTAFCTWNPAAVQRHEVYIQALKNAGVDVHFGKFKPRDKKCFVNINCNPKNNAIQVCSRPISIELTPNFISGFSFSRQFQYRTHEEKQTDVNIAVQVTIGAHDNLFDNAYIVSADSDLASTISLLKNKFPEKDFVSVFPPRTYSSELQSEATRTIKLKEKHLSTCQFPNSITLSDGKVITIPETWE